MKVLLLAGTAEARALSLALDGRVRLVTSLAGATRDPADYGGAVRTGGFGGAEGLAGFLRAEGIAAVIDATHPFAGWMQANAANACAAAEVPLLRLQRPEWTPPAGARWQVVADLAEAVAALPAGAVAFVAAGRSAATALTRGDIRFLLRAIEPPEALPANIRLVQGRPSPDPQAEAALFRREGVTHLICKNSGGEAGRAKLDAAAALGLPVLIIRRPETPKGVATAATVAEALAWVAALPAASRA